MLILRLFAKRLHVSEQKPLCFSVKTKPPFKKPYFGLKTGEKSSRNLRLKSLIFIIEKYGKKLLSFAMYNMGNYHNVKNKYRLLVDTYKILCNFVLWWTQKQLSCERHHFAHLQRCYRSMENSNQRLKSIEIRKDLTDQWKLHNVEEGIQYATLTDIIYQHWAGKTAKEYKKFKGLKKENLRDNMTNEELVLNILAELSTTSITKSNVSWFRFSHKSKEIIQSERSNGFTLVERSLSYSLYI